MNEYSVALRTTGLVQIRTKKQEAAATTDHFVQLLVNKTKVKYLMITLLSDLGQLLSSLGHRAIYRVQWNGRYAEHFLATSKQANNKQARVQ